MHHHFFRISMPQTTQYQLAVDQQRLSDRCFEVTSNWAPAFRTSIESFLGAQGCPSLQQFRSKTTPAASLAVSNSRLYCIAFPFSLVHKR